MISDRLRSKIDSNDRFLVVAIAYPRPSNRRVVTASAITERRPPAVTTHKVCRRGTSDEVETKWKQVAGRARCCARRTERKLLFWRRDRDGTRHIHVPRPSGGLRPCKTAFLQFCRTLKLPGSSSPCLVQKIKKPHKGAFSFSGGETGIRTLEHL